MSAFPEWAAEDDEPITDPSWFEALWAYALVVVMVLAVAFLAVYGVIAIVSAVER